MKKQTTLIALILLWYTGFSQNLVINGNFDTIIACPSNQGQLTLASPWTSARGTCDLYNACATGSQSTPSNVIGNQAPRSGAGYAGFFAAQGMWVNETREYLHAQLRSVLIAGHTYCLTFYVNLSDSQNSFGDYDSDMAVNDIGAYFSATGYTPDPFNFAHLPVSPQVVNPSSNQLSDRANWMQISGSFTATGGEQYITIGSFSSNASQDTTELDIWQTNKTSYYYIDDVNLVDCSAGLPLTAVISGVNSVCEGAQISLGTAVSGGSSPYQYSWNGGAFTSSATYTATAVSSGTFSVDIQDANGTVSSATYSVTVVPLPNGSVVRDTSVCPGISVTVAASGGSSYAWHDGPSGIVQTTTPAVSVQLNADWDLLVDISNGTCTDVDTVSFHVLTLPSVHALATDTIICTGENAVLTMSSGGSSYAWQSIQSYTWTMNQNVNTVTVSPQVTTDFIASMNDGQCWGKDTIRITVLSPPLINLGSDKTICSGQSVTLSAVSSQPVAWNTGASTTSIQVSPLVDTLYYAIASNGECTRADTIHVYTMLPPVANAGADQQICSGDVIQLNGQGGGTYQWNTGENTASIMVQPLITSLYILTVSNGTCTDADTITVKLIPDDMSPCKEIVSAVKAPDIFSPNGDGINDVFSIWFTELSELDVKIYNRWGQLVAELNKNIPAWDGNLTSGRQANAGTYYYLLKAKGNDQKETEQSGFIELVR